jgi:hypothetical protein
MTEEELNAIEARANAATPGPWGEQDERIVSWQNPDEATWICDCSETEGSGDDMPFIAHARNDVPALMAHIRELKRMFASESFKCTVCGNVVEELHKEITEAYAELARYQAQAFRGVAYEPTEEVNVEVRRARDEKQHRIDLLHRAATTDGAHHKQWVVVEVLRLLGEDTSTYEEGVQP